jgi:hypothetical protein
MIQSSSDNNLRLLEPYGREDLLEIIDDRAELRATVITAQLPMERWHVWIGEPTIAGAILDRLLHHAHRLTLKGESLRRAPKESKPHTGNANRDQLSYYPHRVLTPHRHRSR